MLPSQQGYWDLSLYLLSGFGGKASPDFEASRGGQRSTRAAAGLEGEV